MRLTLDMKEYPPHPLWICDATLRPEDKGYWLAEVPAEIADLVKKLHSQAYPPRQMAGWPK